MVRALAKCTTQFTAVWRNVEQGLFLIKSIVLGCQIFDFENLSEALSLFELTLN